MPSQEPHVTSRSGAGPRACPRDTLLTASPTALPVWPDGTVSLQAPAQQIHSKELPSKATSVPAAARLGLVPQPAWWVIAPLSWVWQYLVYVPAYWLTNLVIAVAWLLMAWLPFVPGSRMSDCPKIKFETRPWFLDRL